MIFRNRLGFLDKVTNIRIDGDDPRNDIYMITDPNNHNDIVYIKENSDRVTIKYRDDSKSYGVSYKFYDESILGETLQFCNQY